MRFPSVVLGYHGCDQDVAESKTHVQWCVRDPKRSIIGYFRPRDSEASET
jgi:hypothetical protein